MKRLLLLLALCCCLVGCDDDDGATPDAGFDVTFRVVDPAGDPVEGLMMSLCSDNDFLQDAKSPPKPAVTLLFEGRENGHVLLTIEDVTGAVVRTLYDAVLDHSGSWHVMWDGLDEQGERLSSGRYTARMIATVNDVEAYAATQELLMCILDPQRYSVGVTNAAGEIVVHDDRLFPHLHETEPVYAYDESGSPMGEIVLDETMLIYLFHPTNEEWMHFREAVSGDGALVEMTWTDPLPPRKPLDKNAVAKDEPPAIPPAEWRLYPPYPNPFN